MIAKILTLDEFKEERRYLKDVVATSGGFDPIHPGHLSCIYQSKQYGKYVVVIVNGDWFLKNKKGKAFQSLKDRCEIVSYIKNIDYVIPFEIENDSTVCEALKIIQPNVFTKGGDRIDGNTPETQLCHQMGINIIYNVGKEKLWSSSDILKNYFANKN